MIEKINISLWEVFSFLLTGLLAISIVTVFLIAFGSATPVSLFAEVKSTPAAILLAVGPLVCTLIGMLIEPIANYFDRYVLAKPMQRLWKPAQEQMDEEALLKEEIRGKYLGSLNNRIADPFYLCKEYVETKKLSTSFMVFLARYGFYRNCTFMAACSGIAVLFLGSGLRAVIFFFGCCVMGIATRVRQAQFFSYMAPAIYRAFLIDKVEWKPHA